MSEAGMRVVNIYPEDVVVAMEMRGSALKKLHQAMQHCELTYAGPDKEKHEAQKYFENEFYPFIDGLVGQLNGAG